MNPLFCGLWEVSSRLVAVARDDDGPRRSFTVALASSPLENLCAWVLAAQGVLVIPVQLEGRDLVERSARAVGVSYRLVPESLLNAVRTLACRPSDSPRRLASVIAQLGQLAYFRDRLEVAREHQQLKLF